MNYNNRKFYLIIFTFCLFVFGSKTEAAILSVSTESKVITTEKIFTASVVLNTEGQSINAFEGDLNYDSSVLKIENINTGSSFVSFWVEKPENKTSGVVHFSGITPGGVTISSGELFKIVFRSKGIGQAHITLTDVSLLLNDGLGTQTKTKVQNGLIQIKENIDGVKDKEFMITDTTAPEEFTITRSRNGSIFDNKYFIVFSATDKVSGVERYKVCEIFKCIETSSPYVLRNQTPFYYMVVSAYDMNGNMRSSSLVSGYFIVISLVVGGALLYLIFHILRKFL